MISFAYVSLTPMSDANGKSAIDIEFGYGRHGSNVEHYIPSEEEIAAICASIRNHGYKDQNGVWHGPWNETEHMRRAGVEFPRHVEIQEWDGRPGTRVDRKPGQFDSDGGNSCGYE